MHSLVQAAVVFPLGFGSSLLTGLLVSALVAPACCLQSCQRDPLKPKSFRPLLCSELSRSHHFMLVYKTLCDLCSAPTFLASPSALPHMLCSSRTSVPLVSHISGVFLPRDLGAGYSSLCGDLSPALHMASSLTSFGSFLCPCHKVLSDHPM